MSTETRGGHVAELLAEVTRLREHVDAARLEGLTQGFADCEALVVLMFEALADTEDEKALKYAPQGIEREGRETRAACLREAALAVSLGQHRTDAYDPETLAQAHRRASTSPAMASAGGKARQAKLTPNQKTKLAKMAATARWKRAKKGE